jgi:hypothetical protein
VAARLSKTVISPANLLLRIISGQASAGLVGRDRARREVMNSAAGTKRGAADEQSKN